MFFYKKKQKNVEMSLDRRRRWLPGCVTVPDKSEREKKERAK
jgi:hypothetical protein